MLGLSLERKRSEILNETIFTMEVEGFVLTDNEKSTLLDVLNDKIPFQEQLQKYIESAKRRGSAVNVNP